MAVDVWGAGAVQIGVRLRPFLGVRRGTRVNRVALLVFVPLTPSCLPNRDHAERQVRSSNLGT